MGWVGARGRLGLAEARERVTRALARGGEERRAERAKGGMEGEVARKKKKSPLVARRSAVGSNRTVLSGLASASGCLRVLVAPGIVPVGIVGARRRWQRLFRSGEYSLVPPPAEGRFERRRRYEVTVQ